MMSTKAMCNVAFALGAAVGSLVTYILLKSKFDQALEQEIKAAKEYYSCQEKEDIPEVAETTPVEEPEKNTESEVMRDYHALIERYSSELREEESDMRKPYVISPDEFGEKDDYTIYSLTYYEGDGVLTDETDTPIDDVEDTIGKDALNSFGEYEKDSVFVCDDKYKIYYEILRDSASYAELTAE